MKKFLIMATIFIVGQIAMVGCQAAIPSETNTGRSFAVSNCGGMDVKYAGDYCGSIWTCFDNNDYCYFVNNEINQCSTSGVSCVKDAPGTAADRITRCRKYCGVKVEVNRADHCACIYG